MTIAAIRPPATTLPSVASHESSEGSSLSLGDGLALPNPAFRRRTGEGTNSARSSIVSSQDLNSLTSEELWTLGQEEVPDMSNPMRTAAERPLDTVRRLSTIADSDPVYHTGLPSEVICKSLLSNTSHRNQSDILQGRLHRLQRSCCISRYETSLLRASRIAPNVYPYDEVLVALLRQISLLQL